ncbi:hypothetical protein D3C80_403650 [compost metagenome]
MRRHTPNDLTGERVLRRQKRFRIVKIRVLVTAAGILGVVSALVIAETIMAPRYSGNNDADRKVGLMRDSDKAFGSL